MVRALNVHHVFFVRVRGMRAYGCADFSLHFPTIKNDLVKVLEVLWSSRGLFFFENDTQLLCKYVVLVIYLKNALLYSDTF